MSARELLSDAQYTATPGPSVPLIVPDSLWFSCSLKSSGRPTTGIRHSSSLPFLFPDTGNVHGYEISQTNIIVIIISNHGNTASACSTKRQQTNTQIRLSVITSSLLSIIGCLHDPANVQQTSSIRRLCILNTFAGSSLDVCRIV